MDFYTLGPATPVGFALAPGRKRAYGLFEEIGRYEFWKFDLEHRELANRAEFKGRPRMGAEDQLERQGALHLRRRQHHRPLRRRRPISICGRSRSTATRRRSCSCCRRHRQRSPVARGSSDGVVGCRANCATVFRSRDLRAGAPLHRAVLAPAGAGPRAQRRQHRALAVPAAAVARLLRSRADRPRSRLRSCASSLLFAAVSVAQLRASTSSAVCATRACRRTSCSTCGSRCTGTCSGCRRASTRGPGLATSCRESTTTSARFSGSRRRRRSPGSATCCSSSAPSRCWRGSTSGCFSSPSRRRRSGSGRQAANSG